MKLKKTILEFMIGVIVAVFAYIGTIKLAKFEEFRLAIRAQPLESWLKSFLIIAVPIALFLCIVLMAIPKLRRIGLYSTLGLLFIFSGYISLILMKYYGVIPCSCAGISHEWSWTKQLYFNLALIVITLTTIVLQIHISRREGDQIQRRMFSH
jgi:hypothetical protein